MNIIIIYRGIKINKSPTVDILPPSNISILPSYSTGIYILLSIGARTFSSAIDEDFLPLFSMYLNNYTRLCCAVVEIIKSAE